MWRTRTSFINVHKLHFFLLFSFNTQIFLLLEKKHLFDLFQNSKTFCFVFRIDKIQPNNLINWPIKILMQKMQISKCIKTMLIYLLFSSKTKELTLFNIENVLWVKLSWISETDSVFIFKGPYETDSPSDGHHTPVSLKKIIKMMIWNP